MTIFVGKNKFIYYSHIPKTGGTTVEHFFRDNGFKVLEKDPGLQGTLNNHRFCSPQHAEAERVKRNFRIEKFDYIFATVRHPVDRIVSEYKYRNANNNSDINLWIKSVLQEQKKNPYILDNHIRPQWEFILPGSKVFHQEEGLDQQWGKKISDDLDVDLAILPKKMNQTSSGSNKNLLTREILATIHEFYRLDFKFFGYQL